MRLGKEQAAGYVEDTEVDSLPVTEDTTAGPARLDGAVTTAPEPSLTTS